MSNEVDRLELLREKLALLHAQVVAARQVLIEAAGDRICGGGCPSPELLESYEEALRAESRVKALLERCAANDSRQAIEKARTNAGRSPRAAAGC